MISVTEAISKVKSHFFKSKPITLQLSEALHFVLAEDVFSKIDMPPFPQSAMDGYALKLWDKLEYTIMGETKAGDDANFILKEGEAVRIFTGAKVPATADAVIMQEKTSVKKNVVTVTENPFRNQNIRPQGEQIKTGELAIAKATVLTPSAISYLTSLGITEVSVYPKPKVAIVVTGSELQTAGQALQPGKIYESNSVLLKSTLQAEHILDTKIFRVADNYESTEQLLDEVTTTFDFVLVSGGISVGEYDFVGKALRALGTEEIFYKVKQKPGKPLFFGKRAETFVFALPGNPASALTCFYMYALPMLRYFSGIEHPFLKKTNCKLTNEFKVNGDRAQFLKAVVKGHSVDILRQQSSAMISGFIEANAYVFVPENSETLAKEASVEVILLK